MSVGLEQARAAARQAGAVRVDVYSRHSRTRLIVLDGGAGSVLGERVERGLAVRVWLGVETDAACGFHASSSGEAASNTGRLAVEAARRGATGRDDTPLAFSRDEVAARADLFDTDLARCTGTEARRRLQRMLLPAVERLPAGQVRAQLDLAEVESRLLRADGDTLSERGTFAALRLRFPTAFGISRVELSARRLVDLERADLQAMVQAFPPVGAVVSELPARENGGMRLRLSPAVGSALAGATARRAQAIGRPLEWSGATRLVDDPLRPWGPGSISFDGDGAPARRRLVAGPAGAAVGASADAAVAAETAESGGRAGRSSALGPVRLSYREPPRHVPTNLVLEEIPQAPDTEEYRGGAELHLMEIESLRGDAVLARGALRAASGLPAPVRALIDLRLEDLVSRRACAAGPVGPAVPAFGHCFVPELLVPPSD